MLDHFGDLESIQMEREARLRELSRAKGECSTVKVWTGSVSALWSLADVASVRAQEAASRRDIFLATKRNVP